MQLNIIPTHWDGIRAWLWKSSQRTRAREDMDPRGKFTTATLLNQSNSELHKYFLYFDNLYCFFTVSKIFNCFRNPLLTKLYIVRKKKVITLKVDKATKQEEKSPKGRH